MNSFLAVVEITLSLIIAVGVFACNDNDNCVSTPSGEDATSCQFTQPIKACLKDKAWRTVTKSQKTATWGSWSNFGIGCLSGKGMKKGANSKIDLKAEFKKAGFTDLDDTKVEDCPKSQAEKEFEKAAESSGGKMSWREFVTYYANHPEAAQEILSQLTEGLGKAANAPRSRIYTAQRR